MAKRRIVTIYRTGQAPQTYVITARVDVDFERHRKIGMSRAFSGNEGSQENVYWLAWYAQKHASNGVMPEFEAWLEGIEQVELDAEDVAPFGSTASAGTSPSSPSPQE